MAISRMQEPRQLYGLGSLVKKAVRGVKKIVKSPLGKAALIGGLGAFGLGSLGGGTGFLGRFAPSAMRAGLTRMGGWFGKDRMLGNLIRNDKGGLSLGKMGLLGLGAGAVAAPFLMKDDEEEVVEEAWDQVPSSIANIRNQARNYYTNPSESTLAFMPGKQFVQSNFYAADGGRAGLMNGGEAGQEQIEQMLMAEFVKYKNQGGTLSFEEFVQAVMQAQQEQQMPEGAGMEQPEAVAMAADGGRIGAYAGGPMDDEDETTYNPYKAMAMYKRPGKQEGGIMETEVSEEMIDLGGQEKDYRETGGFVDLGGKERADDVPARLSKNEFVFTADAVRNAGGGDIDKGSEVMQNLMDNLEAGGEISEESQGLEGAQAMYDQQQMLQSRIA
jgi:hypothetical protein